MIRRLLVILAVLIAIALVWTATRLLLGPHSAPLPPVVPPPQPTTAPTVQAATTAPAAPATYVAVIRVSNPAIPATQPLAVPLDLEDAAHLIIHNPIYLDSAGMPWITQPGAPSAATLLAHPQDPLEHVVGERVAYVHWWLDDDGLWKAAVVAQNPDGTFTLLTPTDQTAFPTNRHFYWQSAWSWQNRIVVPADSGICVFDLSPKLVEHYHALPGATAASNRAFAVLDTRGLLAWSPWESGHPGSAGASRFVDGNWTDLAGGLWSAKPIQLIPLLDGSVLQIGVANTEANNPSPDSVSLVIAPLDSAQIDQQHITDLVNQLNDPDDQKRQAAFNELSRYGPSLAPMLEQISQDQPPETQLRLRQLLRARVTPALGGMEIIDNRLSVARRQDDGTVIFFASAGVRVPRAGRDEPDTLSPAWLCVRPGGRVDTPLLRALVNDQRPDATTLFALRDDWLVCDDTGVRRFMATSFDNITNPNESRFHRIIGQDRRGRWIIADATPNSPDTLIIDTTIADPSPKLPSWAMTIDPGSTGWDHDNWPVIKRGGGWALKNDAWIPLRPADHVLTDPLPPPRDIPAILPATSQPISPGPLLLRTADDTCYFDGENAIGIIDHQHRYTRWPLPPAAVGSIPALLARTPDGSLYLYNQSGRIVWLKPTGNPANPYHQQAIFTRGVPNTDHPTRMWLDPAGRLDFVYDKNQLVIFFPTGNIPPEIQQMMPN